MADFSDIFAVKLKADEALVMALRPEQAAKTLSVSLSFLQREIREGKLQIVKKGRGSRKTILITLAAINEYLKTSEPANDSEVDLDLNE